ncbi:helix-turn-helix domain-containing protein [Ruminococcus sp.]|uniref:helix-turn-helix domain-containing protein n=1 Tax=Ruminococcus sp. TaxID=41978 RepID=UPI00386EE5A8
MRLKDIREDHDYTQKYVADLLFIKQNTYSQYETGQRQIPLDFLVKLAMVYETSTDYILGLTDEKKPYPRSEDFILQ